MITEQEMMKLKHGDKVLVECTVEAVFIKSGMVMVTTRDCDKGFDAYEDEVIAVMPDKVTNGDVIKAIFKGRDLSIIQERLEHTHWWNAPYKEGVSE